MKLHVIAVGHKMPGWIDAGYDDYARRMPPDMPLLLNAIKPGHRAAGEDGSRARQLEAERILAALPAGAGWGQILGVAILCGIGFTMSLFVGSLAFAPGSSEYAGMDRMGILTGSFFAAVIGYAVTAMASRKTSVA